jgi:hypothetical protein
MKWIFVFVSMLTVLIGSSQPGRYAGSKKALIGKTFTKQEEMPQLKGWEYYSGTVMNIDPMTAPELHMAEVYKKGTTHLIIFLVREDTTSNHSVIADVIEVAGVAKGWSIQTFGCRQYKKTSAYIIALGKDSNGELIRIIKKAWRFNADKRRVEVLPIKGIDCYSETGC